MKKNNDKNNNQNGTHGKDYDKELENLFVSEGVSKYDQSLMIKYSNEQEKEIYELYDREYRSLEDKNMEVWNELRHYFLWYPDVFYDVMGDYSNCKIKLHEDQRMVMRAMARYSSSYLICNRRYGKSFLAVAQEVTRLIILPNRHSAYITKKKQDAAKILNEKITELKNYFPFLKDEILKHNFNGETCTVVFSNGSKIYAANPNSLRGLTITGALIIDEYFFNDLDTIDDASRAATTKRVSEQGKNDPFDINNTVNISSAGARDSRADLDIRAALKDYAETGGSFVFFADYHHSLLFKRALNVSILKDIKKTMLPEMFAMNYETKIAGAGRKSAVPLTQLFEARTLESHENAPIKVPNQDIKYFIAVDYARSENNKGDHSVIVIGKGYFQNSTQCYKLEIVNIIPMSKTLTATEQNTIIKLLDNIYNPANVIVDKNVMGQLFVDDLMKTHTHEGKEFPAFIDLESDVDYDIKTNNTKEHLWGTKTNYWNESQTQILKAYLNAFREKKVKLLEAKKVDYVKDLSKENLFSEKVPYYMTDKFIAENMNCEIESRDYGEKLLIKYAKGRKKHHKGARTKDILMATAYLCWFVFDKYPELYGSKKCNNNWKNYTGMISG